MVTNREEKENMKRDQAVVKRQTSSKSNCGSKVEVKI